MEGHDVRPEATGRSTRAFWVGTPLTMGALFAHAGQPWRETPGGVLLGALLATAVVGAVAGLGLARLTRRFDQAHFAAVRARRTGSPGDVPDVAQAWPRWFTPRAVTAWVLATGVHVAVLTGASLLMARAGVPAGDREPDLWWQLTLTLLFVQGLGVLGGLVVGLLAGGVLGLGHLSRSAPTRAERFAFASMAGFLVASCVSALPLAVVAEPNPGSRRLAAVWGYMVDAFDDPVGRGVHWAWALAAQVGVVVSLTLLAAMVVTALWARSAQLASRRSRDVTTGVRSGDRWR